MLDFQKRQREQARVYSRDKVYAGGSPNFNERTGQYTNLTPVTRNEPLLHIQPMPPNFQQAPVSSPVMYPGGSRYFDERTEQYTTPGYQISNPLNPPTNYQRTISTQPVNFPTNYPLSQPIPGMSEGVPIQEQLRKRLAQYINERRQGNALSALMALLEQRRQGGF